MKDFTQRWGGQTTFTLMRGSIDDAEKALHEGSVLFAARLRKWRFLPHPRIRTYKLNNNSDDGFEPTTDLNQPVGGLAVLMANCAAKARL
jgi:hypothetical protein